MLGSMFSIHWAGRSTFTPSPHSQQMKTSMTLKLRKVFSAPQCDSRGLDWPRADHRPLRLLEGSLRDSPPRMPGNRITSPIGPSPVKALGKIGRCADAQAPLAVLPVKI